MLMPLWMGALLLLAGCGVATADVAEDDPQTPPYAGLAPEEYDADTVELGEPQWRERLSPERFHVLREDGTERAFTGAYHDSPGEGVYRCAGCGLPLYDSADKFDSRTGWPSYTRPIADDAVVEKPDRLHGMVRTELECARCGGHLGHVFNDGPAPTGRRHCINSASLWFVADAPEEG
jgi:peptide-methionine (R)-S-oxide reductase